jgi:hypothetical protein
MPKKAEPLRVWHIPQIPGTPFRVPVASLDEATLLLKTLADYDAFQLRHNIKPDYANAQGLEVYDGAEWSEWESADGDNIGAFLR